MTCKVFTFIFTGKLCLLSAAAQFVSIPLSMYSDILFANDSPHQIKKKLYTFTCRVQKNDAK